MAVLHSTCVMTGDTLAQKTGVWWATGGAAGGIKLSTSTIVAKRLPLSFGNATQMFNADASGTISGTVKVLGTPIHDARVTLFRRQSCSPIASVHSATDGTFSFTNLYKASSDYFAVAIYPEAAGAYNAQVFDQLTPV